jgi:uncharacterized protein (DUF1697 family)
MPRDDKARRRELRQRSNRPNWLMPVRSTWTIVSGVLPVITPLRFTEDWSRNIEDLRYLPGALVRRVDRELQTKSPMTKIVGTPLYPQMTARNVNTVRRLAELRQP